MPDRLPVYRPQSVRDLVAEYFGANLDLYPQESNPTVGTTAVAIGKYARQRIAITISNLTSAVVYIGFTPTVSTTKGIPLQQYQSVSFGWFLDGELAMADFWAISGSSSQTLYVLESVLNQNTDDGQLV